MKLDARNISLYGGGLILVVLVVWSFALTGSPAHQRKLAEDRHTAKRIECMACAALKAQCPGIKSSDNSVALENKQQAVEWLDGRSCAYRRLSCYSYSRNRSVDIAADMSAIDYNLDENNKPVVCGTFHFSAEEQKKLGKKGRLPKEMKNYQAGEQCFTFDPPVCKK